MKAYDQVGNNGLEYQYNKYLQGTDGYARIEVNAQGAYQGTKTPVAARAGDNLQTSIHLDLQRVGQQALQHSIDLAGSKRRRGVCGDGPAERPNLRHGVGAEL